MSNYIASSTDLTSVANAIRTKGGTSASLSFPDGFVSAVQNIPTGGGSTLISKSITANGTYNASSDNADGYSQVTVAVPAVKKLTGTFTTGSSDTSYTISFGETISKYLFKIEMTDESKTTLINSGNASARTYAFTGMYPSPGINNSSPSNCMTTYRVKPSAGTFDYSQTTLNATSSSITISCVNIDGGAQYLYRGYSYNYTILEVV